MHFSRTTVLACFGELRSEELEAPISPAVMCAAIAAAYLILYAVSLNRGRYIDRALRDRLRTAMCGSTGRETDVG